jgi:hypothetical protein
VTEKVVICPVLLGNSPILGSTVLIIIRWHRQRFLLYQPTIRIQFFFLSIAVFFGITNIPSQLQKQPPLSRSLTLSSKHSSSFVLQTKHGLDIYVAGGMIGFVYQDPLNFLSSCTLMCMLFCFFVFFFYLNISSNLTLIVQTFV